MIKERAMIQQEFEERVIVKVSAKEYEAIETVYMQSDLDKDEFCKLWIKMNKSRVNQAKKDKVEEDEKEKTRTMLFELSNMPQEKDFSLLADNYYNKKSKKVMESVGITMQDTSNRVPIFKSVSRVVYEIKQYLHII